MGGAIDFEIEEEWRIEVLRLFEPEGNIIVKPSADNKTKIQVHFQTKYISKPPRLQVAIARILLNDFLDYLRFSLDSDI